MMQKRFSFVALALTMALGACDRMGGHAETAASCSAMSAPPPDAGPQQKPALADQGTLTQRSVSNIVQQMSFQLCTARSNHWIDDEYYREEMTALRKASFESLGVRPEKSDAPAADAGGSNASSADAKGG